MTNNEDLTAPAMRVLAKKKLTFDLEVKSLLNLIKDLATDGELSCTYRNANQELLQHLSKSLAIYGYQTTIDGDSLGIRW
jgi:hypothetical protein